MPITKSAKKALRQSLRRGARNLVKKEAYKSLLKEVRQKSNAGKRKEAEALLPQLYQALDKAAKTRAIAKNKASRLKSGATKLIFRQPRE